MKNLKIYKTLFILIFFIIFFFIIEFLSFISIEKQEKQTEDIHLGSLIKDFKYFLPKEYDIDNYKKFFEKYETKINKGSVIFISSFYLNKENLGKNLPYIFHKKTNRTTYKIAYDKFSLTNIYDLFINDYIKNEIKNPEYIIYFFHRQEYNTMFKRQIDPYKSMLNKRYKIVDDKEIQVIKNRFLILNSLYFVKNIQLFQETKDLIAESQGNMDLFIFYMDEIISKIKKDFFKNTPLFIIINFENFFPEENKAELEELGYIIINQNDFISNTNSSDDITEYLIKKLRIE